MPYLAVGLATGVSVLLGLLVVRRGPPLIGWLLVAHGLSFGVLLSWPRVMPDAVVTRAAIGSAGLGSRSAARQPWPSIGVVRAQLMWVLVGALAMPLGLIVVWANYFLLGRSQWLTELTLCAVSVALPVAITIAILRHRLFDIQVVLSRTLTYGSLMVGVVLLYALLLLGAQRIGGSSTPGGLVAVAVAAVTVHPAHSWTRQRAVRWVYGYRSQPQQALRMLASLAEAADGSGLDAAATDAVAEALRADRVWVDSDAVDGDDDVVRVPLDHRGENLGAPAVLVPPGRRLSAADEYLLHDLATYATVLVQHHRQEQQLRESRKRIVAAREEERRRLRQDLHDGVGPCLAAVVLKLNAAESGPDGSERSALVSEALANVVQHARATRCRIEIHVAEHVDLTVHPPEPRELHPEGTPHQDRATRPAPRVRSRRAGRRSHRRAAGGARCPARPRSRPGPRQDRRVGAGPRVTGPGPNCPTVHPKTPGHRRPGRHRADGHPPPPHDVTHRRVTSQPLHDIT